MTRFVRDHGTNLNKRGLQGRKPSSKKVLVRNGNFIEETHIWWHVLTYEVWYVERIWRHIKSHTSSNCAAMREGRFKGVEFDLKSHECMLFFLRQWNRMQRQWVPMRENSPENLSEETYEDIWRHIKSYTSSDCAWVRESCSRIRILLKKHMQKH